MNNNDLIALFDACDGPLPVTVIAKDYRYDGWVIMVGRKKCSGEVRCGVEDSFGRIFIHNAQQLRGRVEV